MSTSGLDQDLALGRVYGEAIFALAAESGREDEVLAELGTVVELLDRESAVEAFVASPLVDDEAKRAVLERALRGRASDLVVDALQVVRSKGRLDALRSIVAAFRERWLVARRRVEVGVTTAVPLGEELRRELQAALVRRTGREPILSERVDAGLLGGMVVRIGDEKIDGSVATRLVSLTRELLARASRELLSGKSYVINE